MSRRLIVSDIHGEGHRLVRVLREAGYEPGIDRLFLLGDYIDRGTDSRVTVEIVRGLVKDGAVALMGNHDFMPIEASRDKRALAFWLQANGGRSTIDSYGGKMPPDDVLEWLDNLPLYHEEPDCILVHAGLRPEVPLSEQDPNDLRWIRDEFHYGYLGKHVYFGHTPTWNLHEKWEVWEGPDKTGIDTGAAYSGLLTLLDIDSKQIWTA